MTLSTTPPPSSTIERTDRPLVFSASVAALSFVALAVSQLVFPEQGEPAFVRTTDYVIEASYVLALWASLVAIVRLVTSAWRRPRFGRLGLASGIAFAAGHLALAGATTVTLAVGHDTLGPLFLVGLAGWFLGGIGLAVTLTRSRALPVPIALLFALSLPLTMVVGHAGPVIAGALWGAVAATAAGAFRR